MTIETKITDAQYTLATLEIFQGNPLIEALPDYVNLSRMDIGDKLLRVPECRADMTCQERGQWLASLCDRLFVPLRRHIELFEVVELMLRQGYRHRNPRPPSGAQYLEEAEERFRKAAEEPASLWHESFSACVVGCSGTGKTSGVSRILELYSQAIRHNQLWTGMPLLQIVHLRVECPHDGGVKALCSLIIEEIGRVAGVNYAETFVKPRSTLESLKMTLVRLMSLHRVGMLVLDEMQNIVNSRKNREDLFNFIVSLSNSLGVPILFIGTPKLKRFMLSNMRTARRFASMGSFNWERLTPTTSRKRKTERGEEIVEEPDADWQRFIDVVWRTNVLREDEVYMPREVEQKLYELTQGVVDFMMKLLILSQMRAMTLSTHNAEIPEKLTPRLLEKVFEDHFSHIVPMVEALRLNDEKKIESFEDISFVDVHFQRSIVSLLGELSECAPDEPEQQRRITLDRIISVLRGNEIEPDAELVKLIEEILHKEPNLRMYQAIEKARAQFAEKPDENGFSRTTDVNIDELNIGRMGDVQ